MSERKFVENFAIQRITNSNSGDSRIRVSVLNKGMVTFRIDKKPQGANTWDFKNAAQLTFGRNRVLGIISTLERYAKYAQRGIKTDAVVHLADSKKGIMVLVFKYEEESQTHSFRIKIVPKNEGVYLEDKALSHLLKPDGIKIVDENYKTQTVLDDTFEFIEKLCDELTFKVAINSGSLDAHLKQCFEEGTDLENADENKATPKYNNSNSNYTKPANSYNNNGGNNRYDKSSYQKKPYTPNNGGYKKPYNANNSGYKKPYEPYKKPYTPAGDKNPYN
jgi:hypothetical protein